MTEDLILPWAESLGLVVDPSTPAGAAAFVMVSTEDATRIEFAREPEGWGIVCRRRLSDSDVEREWDVPPAFRPSDDRQAAAPSETVAKAARQVAAAFPLVRAVLSSGAGFVEVEFGTTIFDDGLNRQSFALTLSGLLKTVETFDAVRSARVEQRGALQMLAESLTLDQIDAALASTPGQPPTPSTWQGADATMPMTASVATHPVEPPVPSIAWMPTHETSRPASAWEQPSATAPVTGTLDAGLPVQVLERYGDWAHVVCSNGWSAWIDGRDLNDR